MDMAIVSIQVKVEGSFLPEDFQIQSIEINSALGAISGATLSLIDGLPASENYPASESDIFIPGNSIEIFAGYDGKNSLIFQGVITAQELSSNQNVGATLSVSCSHPAIRMHQELQYNLYTNQSVSDIISGILKKYGGQGDFSYNGPQTQNIRDQVIQYDQTDWEFIRMLALAEGLVISTDLKGISFYASGESSSSVSAYTKGQDIFDFSAKMSAKSQFSSVQADAWAYVQQQMVSGSNTSSATPFPGNISPKNLAKNLGNGNLTLNFPGNQASAELVQRASVIMNLLENAAFSGEVRIWGTSSVSPGEFITLKGIGSRFDGNWLVSGVYQELSDGNWFTTFETGLQTELVLEWISDLLDAEASPGLMAGKVVQSWEDPDGEFRVQVELPELKSAEKKVWARLATFYAGKNKGAVFFPDVDDEVVVGFSGNNINYPVILGALYSSTHTPPVKIEEDNRSKGLYANLGLSISLDENERSMTLQTLAGNALKLSDQDKSLKLSDQNGGVLEMQEDGISLKSLRKLALHSEANTQITATEGLSVSSNTNIEMNCNGSLNLSGISVGVTAETELSLKGEMSARLLGGMELTLQSAMVMIN